VAVRDGGPTLNVVACKADKQAYAETGLSLPPTQSLSVHVCSVFSFGVVMWEMLTFEVPYGAGNPWQVSLERGRVCRAGCLDDHQ